MVVHYAVVELRKIKGVRSLVVLLESDKNRVESSKNLFNKAWKFNSSVNKSETTEDSTQQCPTPLKEGGMIVRHCSLEDVSSYRWWKIAIKVPF